MLIELKDKRLPKGMNERAEGKECAKFPGKGRDQDKMKY